MIKFHCPSCGQRLGVRDEYAGRRIRCSKCNHPSEVPLTVDASTILSGSNTPAGQAAATASHSASARIELQPPLNGLDNGAVQEDPNAEILRQFRRSQVEASSRRGSKTAEDKPPSFERFGALGKILNPVIARIGSFPLAVTASVLAAALVITVWNLLAVAVGTPLEIFYVATAIAAGMGLCLISEHKGKMMGLLSLFMALLAMVAGRVVQTHLFVLSEWEKVVTAQTVPEDREQLYLMMNQFMGRQSRQAMREETAESPETMAAIAICALLEDGQIDTALGQDLYLASQPQVQGMAGPYDPNSTTMELDFDTPALAGAWHQVTEKLKQWPTLRQRTEAAGRYHFRYLFLQEQCRYKTLLADYPLALTTGFFMVNGCVFMLLRVIYWLVGLIGAYKTCSESFMD